MSENIHSSAEVWSGRTGFFPTSRRGSCRQRGRINAENSQIGTLGSVIATGTRSPSICSSRGSWAYDVAKLLGDTADTVEKHYAPFVRELRERARRVMETRCHLSQHRHCWQVLLHVFYTVLLLAVPLNAQNLPDAPKPRPEQHLFSRRVFVA